MRFVRDIYAETGAQGRPVISFEFFTPKTDEGERKFFANVMPELAAMDPDYCSVTYGAGGSTRGRTFSMVERIQKEFGIPCMAHLTCVGSVKTEIDALLSEASERGIMNLLALRGDPPEGTERFTPAEGGFRFAKELVKVIRDKGGFSIGVAGFPEGHQECEAGKFADWEHLRAKINEGADFVLTQLFFDNAYFHQFRAYLVEKLKVSVPIVPGIIPILSARQIKRFTDLCGASLPIELERRLTELEHDDEAAAEAGVRYAVAQCKELLDSRIAGLHFYTLNRARPVSRILERLGPRSAK